MSTVNARKYLVTGDLHWRASTPRGRTDNYPEALARNLQEVFGIARAENVKAILIPGDIFDSPSLSLTAIGDLAAYITTHKQQGGCPIYTIPGNHDLFAGNQETLPRTPYGLLARLGYIASTEGLQDVSGHGYTTATDTLEGMAQFDSVADIHMVHSMLLPEPPGFDMRHTLIKDVKTNALVIACGHDHAGFGVIRREDGVVFINPGALERLAASKGEMDRTVQVALVTIGAGDRVDVDLMPLKSARPASEVLSREHIEYEAARDERIEDFLNLLASEGEQRFLEVAEIIDDIAARENIPVIVKKEVLRRIASAREQLGIGGEN